MQTANCGAPVILWGGDLHQTLDLCRKKNEVRRVSRRGATQSQGSRELGGKATALTFILNLCRAHDGNRNTDPTEARAQMATLTAWALLDVRTSSADRVADGHAVTLMAVSVKVLVNML